MTVLQNVALVGMFGCAALDAPKPPRPRPGSGLEFTGLQDRARCPTTWNLHPAQVPRAGQGPGCAARLVLLDEVLSGLTPARSTRRSWLIRRIRDQGSTIVFVEHVMRAVMALTDRIVVLNHGKLIAQGPATEVMQNREVVEAYLGVPPV